LEVLVRTVRPAVALIVALSLFSGSAFASGLDEAFRSALDGEISTAGEGEGGFPSGADAPSHSKRKAFLLSLLLPGLGQRYNEALYRSYGFFAAEAMIWTAFTVFKIQEHLRTDDFEEYARAYAGVSGTDPETEYYRILTIFNSSEEYNAFIRAEARQIYGDDLEARERYFEENGYGADREFRWRTNVNRLEYRLIRNDAIDSGRRADYALVAAVLNRGISALEAARGAGRWAPVGEAARHIRVTAAEEGDPALRVGWTARF
jgi:hypothetical protein